MPEYVSKLKPQVKMAPERIDHDQAQVDSKLVERAREGDTEAFGELIHAHREKARRWAQRMTGDPFMADDVVQDALIRAFLHLGSLADTSRFLPWLYRILQNQANMLLRRGGPYHREQPFTSFQQSGPGSSGTVDWDDLDSILHYLSRSASYAVEKQNDPAEPLLRKEMYETIHALLHCLNRRERGIFEAHFFRQLSPDEIALMYNTTTGSVYTYLHRSRRKLQQEQVRVALGLHQGGGRSMINHKILQLPEWKHQQKVMVTFIDRIAHLLAALGDKRSVTELMGLSGFAFRMKISNKTTFADGIYIFDWRQTFRELMEQLGYEVSILCGQLSDTPVPLLAAAERFPVVLPIEEAVLPFVRKYVDGGKPVLYFDTLAQQPYVHEWSLVYGYDDEKRVIYLTDAMHQGGKTLPYEEVAENPLRFLAGIDGTFISDGSKVEVKGKAGVECLKPNKTQAEEALRGAVRYARKGCSYVPMTVYLSYTSGLAAYDRWISYLRDPSITPNRYGMGQLAAFYAETKSWAALYLRVVPLEGEAMRLILLASEAYEQAAGMLEVVSARVPFTPSREVLSRETLELCAKDLELARDFEAAGVGYMEKAILLNERRKRK